MKTYNVLPDNGGNLHVNESPQGDWVPADVAELLRHSLAEMQSWVTDGGHEDDPDVAYMCGKARAALAAADGEEV